MKVKVALLLCATMFILVQGDSSGGDANGGETEGAQSSPDDNDQSAPEGGISKGDASAAPDPTPTASPTPTPTPSPSPLSPSSTSQGPCHQERDCLEGFTCHEEDCTKVLNENEECTPGGVCDSDLTCDDETGKCVKDKNGPNKTVIAVSVVVALLALVAVFAIVFVMKRRRDRRYLDEAGFHNRRDRR